MRGGGPASLAFMLLSFSTDGDADDDGQPASVTVVPALLSSSPRERKLCVVAIGALTSVGAAGGGPTNGSDDIDGGEGTASVAVAAEASDRMGSDGRRIAAAEGSERMGSDGRRPDDGRAVLSVPVPRLLPRRCTSEVDRERAREEVSGITAVLFDTALPAVIAPIDASTRRHDVGGAFAELDADEAADPRLLPLRERELTIGDVAAAVAVAAAAVGNGGSGAVGAGFAGGRDDVREIVLPRRGPIAEFGDALPVSRITSKLTCDALDPDRLRVVVHLCGDGDADGDSARDVVVGMDTDTGPPAAAEGVTSAGWAAAGGNGTSPRSKSKLSRISSSPSPSISGEWMARTEQMDMRVLGLELAFALVTGDATPPLPSSLLALLARFRCRSRNAFEPSSDTSTVQPNVGESRGFGDGERTARFAHRIGAVFVFVVVVAGGGVASTSSVVALKFSVRGMTMVSGDAHGADPAVM